jgi:primosomal protein N' (replication factor Y) (superfamily II helicase)
MSARLQIACVAVAAPIRRLFDYLVPPDQPLPCPGVRVRVPFGSSRSTIGVVVAVASASRVPKQRLKSIVQALDAKPLLPEPLLSLLSWAASYYHHPIGEVIAAALPVQFRRRDVAVSAVEKVWTLTPATYSAST